MKIAFLYGGQGSQQAAMGLDLYERYNYIKEFYNGVNISFDLKDYSFYRDLETISETKYTQPIMVAFQIAVTKILKDNKIVPDFVAGLSIGEYSALVAANVLKDYDAISIADFRGEAMTEASKGIDTGMVAVMGLGVEDIEEALKGLNDGDEKVEIANINCPGQIVISGEKSKVDEAVNKLKEFGARRTIPLNVSGPFHTSYMNEVSEKLELLFKDYEFKEEEIPVIFNYLGNIRKGEDIKDLMVKQVSSTVRFQESIEYMINQGVDIFVEIGFGDVLKGFIKKINKKVKTFSINNVENIESFIEEIKNEQ